ncbi:hypothetical protein HK098_006299 [Nowakowskiella sp. JEL0407]|nr:hypothetical protein HK098_006299 [Nowakowskiella sp. JEL0407]
MSSDSLVWLITRNYHAHLVTKNGVVFSKEHGNLTNKQAFKYSGYNAKHVDVSAANKGAVLTLSRAKASHTPANASYSAVLTKDVPVVLRSVENTVRGYRPDLKDAAVTRAARIVVSQKTPKPLKQKTPRGKKALSA